MRSLDSLKVLWVWHPEAVGGVNANIFAARAAGCNALLFKHDDGGRPFVDRESTFGADPQKILRWRDVCRDAGLAFGLWGYHYGKDLEGEREMVKRAADLKPDFYVVDWEVEFETVLNDSVALHYQAAWMARICHPDVGIFHAPLAQPQYHRPWQYRVFNHYFDGMMPQIYHGAMQLPYDEALRRSYDDYAEFGLNTVPIYPAGQAYSGVSPEDITAWAEMAQRVYGAKGFSWWSAEHLTPEFSRAIRRVNLEVPMRRVNGIHPQYLSVNRRILPLGTHHIPVRQPMGLLASDRRVVLDLEFAPVPSGSGGAPVIIIRDGDGSYAGHIDSAGPWRKSIPVYLDATPEGRFTVEVHGVPARVVLIGLLEVGG